MIFLLIGFVVPAIICAIIGLVACMKKQNAWKASYISIDTSDYYQGYEQAMIGVENESSFYIPRKYERIHSPRSVSPLPPSYSETFNNKDIKPKFLNDPRRCIEKFNARINRAPGYARLINESDNSYQEKYVYSNQMVPSPSNNWRPSPLPLY